MEKMREVVSQTEEANARTVRAKGLLNTHFTWSAVTKRIIAALTLENIPKKTSEPVTSNSALIDVVSTWQQQCGIATYCQSLMAAPAIISRLGRVFARNFARNTGIVVEPVYTAKMILAIKQLVQEDYFKPGSKVLCIHTGGIWGGHGLLF